MLKRGLSSLDSLVCNNVGVLVYLTETKLEREGEVEGSPRFLQPVNLASLTVTPPTFLPSDPVFLAPTPYFSMQLPSLLIFDALE